jgi:hypothetical protein
VWYGVVWYGVVWYGVVWFGLVWFGLVYSCVGVGLVWFWSSFAKASIRKMFFICMHLGYLE